MKVQKKIKTRNWNHTHTWTCNSTDTPLKYIVYTHLQYSPHCHFSYWRARRVSCSVDGRVGVVYMLRTGNVFVVIFRYVQMKKWIYQKYYRQLRATERKRARGRKSAKEPEIIQWMCMKIWTLYWYLQINSFNLQERLYDRK